MSVEIIYSAAKAANLLGISKKTLLKYANEGRIAYVRYPGGAFRFRESTLNFFLGHNTVPATKAVPASLLKKKAA